MLKKFVKNKLAISAILLCFLITTFGGLLFSVLNHPNEQILYEQTMDSDSVTENQSAIMENTTNLISRLWHVS